MAIGANDGIRKYGTQDEVTVATPSAVANDAYSVAADISSWVNDDDADIAGAVLLAQFATMPTTGNIQLFARLNNIQSTTDMNLPDANFPEIWVGTFNIDFGSATATDMALVIPMFEIPSLYTSQSIDWHIKNNGTSQSLSSGWALFITPMALGIA